MRHVFFQFADRLVKALRRLRRFWRKELERKRRRPGLDDVADVHDLERTFVPFASGQLIITTSRSRFELPLLLRPNCSLPASSYWKPGSLRSGSHIELHLFLPPN